MPSRSRSLAHGGILAALYVALAQLQNLLLPGSATWAVQLRWAEALCVLAFFTPSAIWGLSIGCFVFNLAFAAALPLDLIAGTAATCLSAWGMYRSRRLLFRGIPLAGLTLPAICNGIAVGGVLTLYLGGGLAFNCLSVAAGELAVLLTLGRGLYLAIRRRGLEKRLFS